MAPHWLWQIVGTSGSAPSPAPPAPRGIGAAHLLPPLPALLGHGGRQRGTTPPPPVQGLARRPSLVTIALLLVAVLQGCLVPLGIGVRAAQPNPWLALPPLDTLSLLAPHPPPTLRYAQSIATVQGAPLQLIHPATLPQLVLILAFLPSPPAIGKLPH